ncbi:GTPase-activating protein [Aspergillus nanangensis]|uniref:GTPase-activating protein n=1 Tax=Aspergillus nanangensis TaxID=2582783 RepID=A0AAD4CBL8_ASPNN|nr:GTPase-activating protein [Aspergillus nanangensis]
MDILSKFGRTRPETVPTDRVIPLRYWDDLHYLRSLCHDFTFRFDDVLDAAKLEAALDGLMNLGDWGQLGARLRLNKNGKLEYHIPAEYDKNTRPAFTFTSTSYGMSIKEHDLGSRLPKTGQDQSSLSPQSAEFAPLVCHPDSPRSLADWIYTDRPQLHVHVAVFQDTTLLTVSYLHTLFDAVARTNFFHAWIAVLQGRDADVPPFTPFDHDPLADLGKDAPKENYTNFHRLVSGFALVLFGLRYLFELLWFHAEEEHSIRLPGRCVQQMREKARQELAGTSDEAPFISEPDVVAAWWLKTLVTALNPASNRPVMVMSPFNVWSVFSESFPGGGKGFIGNAFFNSYNLQPAGDILQANNLATLASKNRQALLEHRTPAQVQAMTSIQRSSPMQIPPLVGGSDLLFLTHTNQHKARYFECDFSAAVVTPGVPVDQRPHALGRPSYINDIEHCQWYPTRNVCRVIGKDAAGDWWLLFKTRAEAWPVIHQQEPFALVPPSRIMSGEEILLHDIQPPAGAAYAPEPIYIPPEPRIANFFSIYRYATASQLCTLCLSACCAVVAGAAMPLVTIVFGELAAEFIEHQQGPSEIQDRVRHLTLQLVYIATGSLLATLASTWGLNALGEQLTRQLQQRFLTSALHQEMGYFDTVGTADLLTHMDHDMRLIQTGISQKLGGILSGMSSFVVALACAFRQNPRFAAIMLVQPIALLLLVGAVGSRLSAAQQTRRVESKRADSLAQEVLSAMRNVLAYRSQARYARKYHDNLLRPASCDFRERLLFGVIVAGSFTILHWANGLGFWQADRLFHRGQCTIPQALSIMYAVNVAGGMLCQALPFVADVMKAHGAARRVFEVIRRPVSIGGGPGRAMSRVQGEISFEDVSFAYPSRPGQVLLKNVSFTVSAGQTVALVGPSGAGKSTVFALVELLYRPLSGTIMLDGVPIHEVDVEWLRAQIGYVSQDITLFRTSLHENIAYGLSSEATEEQKLDAPAIRMRVIQAAETAQIHSFIAALPQGYDTVIGANGGSLSGGQRQRLAIARAIVAQPSILLLDEATASLDSQSEKEVQEALRRASVGRTTLIIAHRLSTVQNADSIVVLHDGQVLDQGSHVALMESSALYLELVQQQALRSNDRTPCPERTPETGPKGSLVKDGAVAAIDEMPLPKAPLSRNGTKQVWHLNRPELSHVLVGVVLSILAGISYPVQAIFFGNGVISIMNPRLSTGGHSVQFWALMYLFHGIVVFMVYCVRGYCFAVSSSQLHLRARARLFKALLQKPLPFFEGKAHSVGALTSLLSSVPEKIVGISGTSLGLVVEGTITLLTGITVSCIFGWKLGLASATTVPLIAASSFLQYVVESRVQEHVDRDTHAMAVAQEAFAAIKTVTILSLQPTVIASFNRESIRDGQPIYWAWSAALYACTTSLRILSIAFVFWYAGTHLIASGEYTIQQFFVCFAATVWGSQAAATLFAHAPDLAGARAAAARLGEFMLDEQAVRIPEANAAHVPSSAEDLDLQHITFRYPSRPDRLALSDFCLHVPPGAFIALVGTTGSGKSSVINLVERFYVAESGAITLGNRSIEEYDVDSYRGSLALVDQSPCLVGEDLREALQGNERAVSDEEIMDALGDVGLAGFVASLPQGLSTPMLSNGSTLSGGQRQRVAIAKALLCNPQILLLDEATSALDSFSEQVVQDALRRVMTGRTTIAVTHRLKTIVDATATPRPGLSRAPDPSFLHEAGLCVNAISYLIETGAKYKRIFSSLCELFQRMSDVLERCKIYVRLPLKPSTPPCVFAFDSDEGVSAQLERLASLRIYTYSIEVMGDIGQIIISTPTKASIDHNR